MNKIWINSRKRLLKRIKKQISLRFGLLADEIPGYIEAYKKDIYRKWSVSLPSTLLQSIESSELVYGGDFHPFLQSQKAHLRVLRSLPRYRKVVIALEAIDSVFQTDIDCYLCGQISEKEFLKRVHWEERWGFPWENYRPFFDLAKKRNYKLIGLNYKVSSLTDDLYIRDKHAAEIIFKNLNPSELVYVVYGDLHIARAHIPEQVNKIALRPIKSTFIYLNPEKVYFKLASQNIENETEVIQYRKDQFAIINSTPWVKWQSYLMYLEKSFDYDLDEDFEGLDLTDHVASLIRFVSDDLSLKITPNDIEVYSSSDEDFSDILINELDKKSLKISIDLMENGESFYIPETGVLYLANASVNHAADLVGQYIHAKTSNRNRLFWSMPKDFIGLIWIEAISFFISKLINPKRPSRTLSDIKLKLTAFQPNKQVKDALVLAIDQKMKELVEIHQGTKGVVKYKPSFKSSYIYAARFLGPILGEKIYLLYGKSTIDVSMINHWMHKNIEDDDFVLFYNEKIKFIEKKWSLYEY